MTSTGTPAGHSVESGEVADHLDRLYCYHLMMVQWSIAVGSRLSESPQLLLADFHRDAHTHLEAAIRLANRVAELNGTVTADPSDIAYRAPIDTVELPDNPTDTHRTLVQLHRLTTAAITAYSALLETIRESDPASGQVVELLLAVAVDRATDLVRLTADDVSK
jgi:ferritin-like protein